MNFTSKKLLLVTSVLFFSLCCLSQEYSEKKNRIELLFPIYTNYDGGVNLLKIAFADNSPISYLPISNFLRYTRILEKTEISLGITQVYRIRGKLPARSGDYVFEDSYLFSSYYSFIEKKPSISYFFGVGPSYRVGAARVFLENNVYNIHKKVSLRNIGIGGQIGLRYYFTSRFCIGLKSEFQKYFLFNRNQPPIGSNFFDIKHQFFITPIVGFEF